MKFVVDFMLGKLAKTLRILGFDTKYVNLKGNPDGHRDSPLLPREVTSPLHEAMKEGRILLTRAHNLPKSPNIFVIESEDWETQLKELDAKFKIKSNIQLFTRCLICNTPLRSVNKSKAKGNVPFYVYQTQKEFAYCSGCKKFYWKGTHYKDMERVIKKTVDFL